MKYLFTYILLFACLLSMSQSKFNIQINGKLLNNNNQYSSVSLESNDNNSETIASATIKDNQFVLSAYVKVAGFYLLKLDDNNKLMLILQAGENISLTADVNNFSNPLEIEGSKETKLLIELYKKISYLENKQDSLNSVYKNYANSPAIDSILPVLREEYSKNEVLIFSKIKDFILANLTSMAGLVFIDKLNPDLYGDLYIKYDSSLTKNFKNNPFIEQFNQHVEKALRLAIGKVAPEIEETDTAGKKVKLSSLRGKVVLIDFWASWCGPCRRESPNMVRIYNKYKSKGFEIFGVSLDKNKESWLAAIKKDNLKWTHISDLGYWDSRPGRAYSVSSIPYTVLIDDKGRILAKGLRGEELEEKLEQFFNNNPK